MVLVTLTLFAASLVAGLDLSVSDQRWQFLVLALVILLTFCVNLWMLQQRFAPAGAPDRPDRADRPGRARRASSSPGIRSTRSTGSRRRSTACCTASTRSAGGPGKLVLRAQEEERRRVARDLHDEVNQALTAILLRLEALAQDAPERSGRGGASSSG